MPLAHRRPALLTLSLPNPPLACVPASTDNTPTNLPNVTTQMTSPTPEQNPITPVNRRRDPSAYAHHRASIDSWCSSISSESNMGAEYEWTPAQLQTLCKTLEGLPSHLFTPFVGAVPPQNVLQKLALNIKDARGPIDWPHSVKSTRQMLNKLASKLAAPPLADAAAKEKGTTPPIDATNTPPKRPRSSRVPMYRKNSMDELLPSTPEVERRPVRSTKENAHIARACTRLQSRADRFFTFHPYANPARNRDSVLSAASTSNSDPTSGALRAPLDLSAPPQPRRGLRRTPSSTSSHLAIVEEGIIPMELSTPICLSPAAGAPPSSFPSNLPPTLARITHRTSNPCMTRVRPQRSASFGRPLSTGPTVFSNDITETLPADCMGAAAGTGVMMERGTLKRAPSYGVIAQQKKDDAKKAKEQEKEKEQEKQKHLTPPTTSARAISPGVYSSDEEEKRRGKTVKRMKTMTRQPSFLGPELDLQTKSSKRDLNLPSCRAQPQTISVETFTMSSMSSLESLPSLSSSSSTTQLSMRSAGTSKTKTSSSSKNKEKSKASSSSKDKKKAVQSPPAIQVTPTEPTRGMSISPPRTLRRVGNKPLKLEPLTAADLLLSPPAASRPPRPPPKITTTTTTTTRARPLGEIGRKISFGSLGGGESKKRTSDGHVTSTSTSTAGGLLGAAFGLNSPFEEKPRALPKERKSAWSSSSSSASSAVGPATTTCKPPVKYLF